MASPIVPALVPTRSEAFDAKEPPRPPCRGCGYPAHGSVGVAIRCLEDNLEHARKRLRRVVCRNCGLHALACVCPEVKP